MKKKLDTTVSSGAYTSTTQYQVEEGEMAERARWREEHKGTGAAAVAEGGSRLRVQRYFTTPGVDPFDQVQWERRNAVIQGEKGEIVFEQRDVEFPAPWSQLATNVVVSKYFRGALGGPERE